MDINVAVIMSVYKGDELSYIKDSLDSVLYQSYKNIDIYLYVDGEISDHVDSYLSFLRKENANFFVFKSLENNGLAYAMNFLIDKVIHSDKFYSYIARMDSDDIAYPLRIEKQVNYLNKNKNIDVLGTYCREFGSSYALDEKKLPRDHNELLDFSITRCPFIHPTVMFRMEIFKSGYKYPEKMYLTEDMLLWFVLLNSGFKFSNLGEVLLDYRINDSTILRRKGLKKAANEFKLRMINMFRLKRISFKNVFLIHARLFFHLLPARVIQFMYKNFR